MINSIPFLFEEKCSFRLTIQRNNLKNVCLMSVSTEVPVSQVYNYMYTGRPYSVSLCIQVFSLIAFDRAETDLSGQLSAFFFRPVTLW